MLNRPGAAVAAAAAAAPAGLGRGPPSLSFSGLPTAPPPPPPRPRAPQEPVLYINGRPFVVREADKPFANLEYTGIDRARVEGMEARLKADVLQEAGRYGGQVLVAHEDDHFNVIEHWEPVTEADVQTPAEVYAEVQGECVWPGGGCSGGGVLL